METRPGTTRTRDDELVISCLKCELSNPRGHRFCRQCGSVLWKQCAQCGGERPIDEVFCAACGADMNSAERQLIETATTQLAEVKVMIARQQFNDAVRNLNYLVSQNHPNLEEIRRAAQELIPQVTAQCEEIAQRAKIHIGRAENMLEELQFSQAIAELNKIPASLRDRSAQRLLEQAVAAREEIEQLKQRLLRKDGIAFLDRMATIRRLQELQPYDPQVQGWATQIHDHVLVAASKKAKGHCYQESVALLRSIPDTIHSDKSRKLQHHVEELEYLAAELQLAPTVGPASLEAAKRLIRIDEGNQEARAALQEMTKRYQAAKANANEAEWTPCPRKTHIGVPVHAWIGPQNLRGATPEIEARLQQHPGQFFVACGLALQALGRAAVPVNLMPPIKQGVLDRLRSNLGERPASAAWGLDLSNTGLKAIQLTVDDDDQLRVTQCIHVAHRLNPSQVDDAGAGRAILRASLDRFTSQSSLTPSDRIAMQWPAIDALVRYLALPPVQGKKLRDAIQYEAQSQIPFPLDNVCWDTFQFPAAETDTAGPSSRFLLIAARRDDLEKRLAFLKESGIHVTVLQCDALALHNFLHFDRWEQSETASQDKPFPNGTGVAVLDIGSDATGVVLSFPDFVWFRASRPAGDDLTTSLVRRFKITREVAERVKRDPTKVKRMSDLYEESSVVFRKLAGMYENAISDLKKVASHKQVEQLLVTGGGGQTHGLLRYLRFGR